MLRYRLDLIDDAGFVVQTLDFLSADDGQALEEAAGCDSRKAMALWEGDREVAYFFSTSDLYVLAPVAADAIQEAC